MADEKTPETARKIEPLSVDRMLLAEHAVTFMRVYPAAGVEPEEMLSVAYWANVGAIFERIKRQGGEVEVLAYAEDERWSAQFYVQQAGRNWAKVVLRPHSVVRMEPMKPELAAPVPGHTVHFAGKVAKWRVVRDSDQRVLHDKFASEAEAYAWLREYAKSLAA